jgi:hypothetical protein
MDGAPFASAGRMVACAGELPSRLPSTQAKPSRRGPWRPGRSYSGALHLDAMNHARSTVCGSTADGMGAGVSGGLTRADSGPSTFGNRPKEEHEVCSRGGAGARHLLA